MTAVLREARHSNGVHRYELVVMAASYGGVQALVRVLSLLPADFPLPICVVQHRSAQHPHLLDKVLGRRSALVVKMAENREVLQPGTVYLAPPHMHMRVRADRSLAFTDGVKIRHVHSSANPLFESAAEALGGRVIGVVLTGFDSDGTDGVQAIRHAGGIVLAQDEATSAAFNMPRSAIETGAVHQILPLDRIPAELARLAKVAR